MRSLALIAALSLLACRAETPSNITALSKEPVSVRGWIADVKGSAKADETPEMNTARRIEIFRNTKVWIENAPYISGGVGENGSFILLDVPPGNITISFSAPGAENAKLVLENIPGTADVLVPALLLEDGGSELLQPDTVRVRIAANVTQPTPTTRTAIVAGKQVPIIETPLAQMLDRLDYPDPGGMRTVATYK